MIYNGISILLNSQLLTTTIINAIGNQNEKVLCHTGLHADCRPVFVPIKLKESDYPVYTPINLV